MLGFGSLSESPIASTSLGVVNASTAIEGVSSTTHNGTVLARATSNKTLIGTAATNSVGSLLATAYSIINLLGLSSSNSAGGMSANVGNSTTPYGTVSGLNQGNIVVSSESSATLSGQDISCSVGTPLVTTDYNTVLTGAQTTSNIGDLSVSAGASLTQTGVSSVSNTDTIEAYSTSTASVHGVVSFLSVGTLKSSINLSPAALELDFTFGGGSYISETVKFSGEPIPAEHMEDALKLDADAYIDLFQIVLSDRSTKIYLKANSNVDWQGNTYEGTAVQIEGIGSYADDEVARPKFTLFNPAGIYSYLVDQGALDNATIVRYRVLKEHIDSDLPIYRRQQWRMSRILSVKTNSISLELRDMMDGQNFYTPGRMFIPPYFPTVSLQ